ncbi:MAG TPA: hypothetical protein VMU14_23870, partial [Acidimicrobiales bacterium]|nr:hypothetical protein [Acidimicrobiales bacterium]
DVLPTLWFRNTWRWGSGGEIPALHVDGGSIVVEHPRLGGYRLDAGSAPDGARPVALFCDNETNVARLYGSDPISRYPKDGINDHVVSGADTVNPAQRGTKAAWHYHLTVPAGGTVLLRLRLTAPGEGGGHILASDQWNADCDDVVRQRRGDTDEFYTAIAPDDISTERMRILRQSCAGLIWSKQMYPYDVARWLDGDPGQPPPPPGHRNGRNAGWRHLDSFDVLAMPDPWEYPWFAAWDLAFHAVTWAHLDPAFAKYQMIVLLKEWFQHPNGALPAYEWSFDDVNPPVHALAAIRIFMIDGERDLDFLERVFQKLLVNFTWWLNREDPSGHNLFGGGFLGLDNISAVDRSHLPPGVAIQQSDGTAWMAYYSLSMLLMAAALAQRNEVYRDMVVKFAEQFVMVMDAIQESGLYDAEDGFFYDRLVDASGHVTPIKVQSLVGLIPALPAVSLPASDPERMARLRKRVARRLQQSGRQFAEWRFMGTGADRRALISVVSPDQLTRLLATLFDEEAFLSPHGLRSVSKRHTVPYQVPGVPGAVIDYEPAESTTSMYGGNSNWRGPVWFPVNYIVIRSLLQYDQFFGNDYTVEYPTGSGKRRTLHEIAGDLSDRLISIWMPDHNGRRPVYGGMERFQTDPEWKDYLFFHEYFHGDNGAGLGASHQTGWTAIVADLILDPPEKASRLFGQAAVSGEAPRVTGVEQQAQLG